MSLSDLQGDAAPTFPPLFSGLSVKGAADPFEKARAQALLGCDAGLVVHSITATELRAAIVFAPEVRLGEAMAVLIACAVGFQNALGALAPPEVGVHLGWDGGIFVNGAQAGRLRVAASGRAAAAEVDWIVVGLEVALAPADPQNPGRTPTHTALSEEGCVDVGAVSLLEAWVRHSLVWITRMLEDGNRALHAEWRGLARGIGEDVSLDLGAPQTGTFVGVDEAFGMLLRVGTETRLVPLTALLEDQR